MSENKVVSTLELVQRLKEQILEKDRIIREKTGQLKATRDYLERLFGALADAVLVIDAQGRVEFANQAACELLDQHATALIGTPASALCADREQAASFSPEELAETIARGSTQRSEILLRSRDGQAIPVSWSSAALRSEGRPPGLVGIARDIRVQRRLEEEKHRAIQALAASVAHEIRNPLGAIQNSVLLLRRDLQLEGDDATLMEIVLRETQRIAGIVDQFLVYARPADPQFSEAGMGSLLRDVVLLAEQDERVQAGRELLLHVDAELPCLTFDPALIKQVVWNLVSNALDAASSSVAVRARPSLTGGVEVRVADDGPGMEPEVLRQATQPFHTTKAQGTGLGLAISKRIIDAHGGTLRLESSPGAGTTASFILPGKSP